VTGKTRESFVKAYGKPLSASSSDLLAIAPGDGHCCQTRTQSTDPSSRSGVLVFGMFSSSQTVFQLQSSRCIG
jgi:hypothetical protein